MSRYDVQTIKPIMLGVGLPLAAALVTSVFVRTGSVTGISPATAAASSPEAEGINTAKNSSSIKLKILKNEDARQAWKRATQLLSSTVDEHTPENPFYYQNNTNIGPIDPTSLFPDTNPDDPTLTLTGVMQGRTRLAVINGNTFTVGDTVADGWTLTKIDTEERIAIVTNSSGRELTLTAESKGR